METISYIKQNYSSADFWSIRSDLYKKYVKISYEPFKDEKEYPYQRIILTAAKSGRNTQQENAFFFECNGLILEMGTWKPLCIPLPSFKTQANTAICNLMLQHDEMDIYKINDGTIINLYYMENMKDGQPWRISTSNGFDVSDLKWNGKTYREALIECLSKLNIKSEDFYESLDKSHSYTFGFKHPTFHPYYEGKNEPIYNVWFIQKANLTDLTYDFENSPIPALKPQEKVDKPDETAAMQVLYKNLTTAQFEITNGDINYGYILRAKKFSATGQNQHILLESSLLRNIRKLYYDKAYTEQAQSGEYDRDTYICVNSFLNKGLHDKFIQLFPQYKEAFDKLNAISKKLTDTIIEKNTKNTKIEGSEIFIKAIDKISFDINKYITISTSKECTSMVASFISTPLYLNIFYLLFKE